MKNKFTQIATLTPDKLPIINEMFRNLFEWVSRIQYEKVTTASTAPSGGTHGKMVLQDDGTNKVLWIYVSTAWVNVGQMISSIVDHTHSSTSGQGGQLDWDNIWSDAVHSHASNAEGGLIVGGADTNVQFNDGGTAFGGDSLFVYNKTNDWLGLGIVPLMGLHIKSKRKSAGDTASGIIIEAMAAEDCPGLSFFDMSGNSLAAVGLCLKDHNYSKDAHVNDIVLRSKTGNFVFATDDDLSAEYFSKIFIANSGNVAIGKSEIAPETLLEMVGTAPYLTIHNSTHEDIEGGRECLINFRGEQSGGEESLLAKIQASHDGTSDDEKGDLIFYTNDGSDSDSPTERLRIDSTGYANFQSGVAAFNNRDMLRYSFMMA